VARKPKQLPQSEPQVEVKKPEVEDPQAPKQKPDHPKGKHVEINEKLGAMIITH